MPTSKKYLLAGVLGAVVFFAHAASAATAPTLMVLQYLDGGQRAQAPVKATTGATASPTRGKTLERIQILPGDPLTAARRPNDATVELFRGEGIERSSLCSISVRYFRDARGYWVPYFQLNQDPPVVRDPDGHWQLLNLTRGAVSLIMLTSSTLPNAEGFYPALEFGMTNGMVQIDSWLVHPH